MTDPNEQDIETPAAPKEDPLNLGQLTADEFAILARLNHTRVNQERTIAHLEIEKFKIMAQVDGVERALQQEMAKISTRLNIPRDLSWNVFPDGDGNGHARILPNMGAPPPPEP